MSHFAGADLNKRSKDVSSKQYSGCAFLKQRLELPQKVESSHRKKERGMTMGALFAAHPYLTVNRLIFDTSQDFQVKEIAPETVESLVISWALRSKYACFGNLAGRYSVALASHQFGYSNQSLSCWFRESL